MKRRSLLGLLLPAILPAQADDVPAIAWVRCSITTSSGTQNGILVHVTSRASANVRAFEVRVRWRKDFLGRGELQETRTLVSRDASGNGSCFTATGGGESWVQVQVWDLVQLASTVTG